MEHKNIPQNNGDYSFMIADSEEGKMSILKSEVYKTAIMLREAAENSRNDKLMLKDHLSDISHQIKTPLTSLAINLENLEEYPNIAAPTREKLLRSITLDISSIPGSRTKAFPAVERGSL